MSENSLKSKRYRDIAQVAVFSHMFPAVLTVILSDIVTTLVLTYYMYTAAEKNVQIFSPDPEMLAVTYAVLFLATLVNTPFTFCGMRAYYLLTHKTVREPLRMGEIFAPFASPAYLLKGSFLMLIISILNFFGTFVLYFPVFLSFCMAPFLMSRDPQMSVFSALAESRRIMKGRKWLAFRTILPPMILELVLTVMLNGLGLLTVLITSVVHAVWFVALAIMLGDEGEGKNEE